MGNLRLPRSGNDKRVPPTPKISNEVPKPRAAPSKKRAASMKDASPKPRKRPARSAKKKATKVQDSSTEYDDLAEVRNIGIISDLV